MSLEQIKNIDKKHKDSFTINYFNFLNIFFYYNKEDKEKPTLEKSPTVAAAHEAFYSQLQKKISYKDELSKKVNFKDLAENTRKIASNDEVLLENAKDKIIVFNGEDSQLAKQNALSLKVVMHTLTTLNEFEDDVNKINKQSIDEKDNSDIWKRNKIEEFYKNHGMNKVKINKIIFDIALELYKNSDENYNDVEIYEDAINFAFPGLFNKIDEEYTKMSEEEKIKKIKNLVDGAVSNQKHQLLANFETQSLKEAKNENNINNEINNNGGVQLKAYASVGTNLTDYAKILSPNNKKIKELIDQLRSEFKQYYSSCKNKVNETDAVIEGVAKEEATADQKVASLADTAMKNSYHALNNWFENFKID